MLGVRDDPSYKKNVPGFAMPDQQPQNNKRMNIPLTTAVLASLTVAMIVLRIFWLRVPARLRYFLVRLAFAFIVLQLLSTATKWSTTSGRLNAFINWCAIAGYQLIIVLFTRQRPRWLTTISAIILLVPVFASTILMPLGELFEVPARLIPVSRNVVFVKYAWNEGTNSGVDLIIFRKPFFAPFLKRRVERFAFNNQQCNTAAATVTMEPDNQSVRVVCPPNEQNPGPIERVIPLH